MSCLLRLQNCIYSSTSRPDGRQVFQHIFSGAQKGWGSMPHSQSQTRQLLDCQKKVQDGVTGIHKSVMSTNLWLVNADLKDAYFHVAIADWHLTYLQFHWQD